MTVRRGRARHVAVRQADLRCAAGERVLLGGPSGSGKTTLAYLLVRFLDRSAGTARFGDQDLRAWPGDAIRSQILLSEQEPHVFDTTIRENLALARPAVGVAAFALVAWQGWWWATPLAMFGIFVAVVTATHDVVHRSLGLGPRATEWALFLLGAVVLESGHAYRST
nr:ATP-binding cassette domain-containing protein [Micromonospora sp. DSM 115978]